MLAAFGFPAPREDDARRAVEAALDFRDAVRDLRRQPRWAVVAPSVHSGIHSGQVLFASRDYPSDWFELRGRTTILAARLCQRGGPDQILVSETTLGPERHMFDTSPTQRFELKGFSRLVPALAIFGRAPVHSRYAAGLRSGLTPFVARDAELQSLTRTLGQVRNGGCRFVEISGPAGEGKTRLAEEFLRQAAEQGCTVHRGECDANGEPLQPFLQIARSIFGLGPLIPGDEAAERVEDRLLEIGSDQVSHLTTWLRLLSLEPCDAAPDPAPALRALVARLARRNPLVLLLDDWHAADDASREMLTTLNDIPSLFLLMTARPGSAGEVGMRDCELLRLPPFNHSETAQVLARLLPGPDPFLVREICESSGGNPLFIEELCHAVASGEAAPGPREATSWLEVMVQSRLSRLTEVQADLVRVASIIGNTIPTWLFQAITGRDATDSIVAGLAEQDFIFPGEREGTLRFKHGVTREIVYRSIGLYERQALHLSIAQALQTHMAQLGEDEPVEALAYHFGGGSDAPATARYAELAGDKAMAVSALDRAQAHYRAARAPLDRLPADADSAERWDRIAQSFGLAGVFDPSRHQLPIFERALERARARGDRTAAARAQYWLAYIYYGLGEPAIAIRYCERALAALRDARDDPLAVQVRATLGQAKAAAGDYQAALTLLDEAIEVKRRHRTGARPPIGFAYSLSCKAFALGDMGRFAEAHECFQEAFAAIGGLRHEVAVSVLNQHAVVCLWETRFEQALRLADEGMRAAHRARSQYSVAMSRSICAFARWAIDRDPDSVSTLVETTSWLEAKRRDQFTSLNYGWLAEMMVALGRSREGCRYAARALRRARKHDRLGEAMALRAMARAAAAHRWPRPPAYYLDRAVQSAGARGSQHELAAIERCRAQLGV
jgi:tetratricopeptide (TPR) repeat protein